MLESAAAQVSGSSQRTVAFTHTRGSDVVMTVMREGRALHGAPVQVIGPVGTLPPHTLIADADGRVVLASANVPWVRVEMPGSDQIEVRLTGPQVLADFGLQQSE